MDEWVFRELGHMDCGDARLSERALQLTRDMSVHPDGSLPSTYQGDPAGLKAGYRFFDNDRVLPAAMLASHRDATWARCAEEPWVLIAQDTTYFNFTSHPQTTGLGPIESLQDIGLLVHSALAMTTQGVPMGVLAQKIWARDPADHGKSADRKSLPIEEKESYRWLETMDQATAGCPQGTQTVVIGDRESDIYDLFVKVEKDQQHVLVRGAWNRHLNNHPDEYLWPAVEAAPILGSWMVDVPRKPGQPIRQALLQVQTTTVQLDAPAHRRTLGAPTPTVQVILAKECDPPPGATPILWLLLTTLPVEDFEAARRLVFWYTLRWRIERFHFTLKTGGCQVEHLQLQTFARLERAITVYSIIAWHILWLTYEVRIDPKQSCAVAFDPDEIRVLAALREQQRPRKGPAAVPDPPHYRLTLYDAVRTMAKLGGFIGRKSDGEPGIKNLWRGYRRLQMLVWGVHLTTEKS